MHEISLTDWMMFKISISALVEICGTDIPIINYHSVQFTVLFMHTAHTLAWGDLLYCIKARSS